MIKRVILTIAVLSVCILQFSDASLAQSKPATVKPVEKQSRFDKFFAESSAEYWTGVMLDYRSSLNKREANPLFRNQMGGISGTKFFAVSGGVYAVTVALQKKWPTLANWTRRIFAVVHVAAFGHNQTITPYR
jgi:hypothetical protein